MMFWRFNPLRSLLGVRQLDGTPLGHPDGPAASPAHTEPIGDSLAAIVQSSEDAIIGMSLDGTMGSWNPAAERLFGYTAAEVLGESIDILIPADYSHTMPQIMERIRQGEHLKAYETLRVRKDGTLIDVSLGISPIQDKAGRVVGIATIARDITERKHADRRQIAQHAITRTLADCATLSDAAGPILQVLGQGLRWSLANWWTMEPATHVLRCTAIWYSPLPGFNEVASVTRESSWELGSGLPGRIWSQGKPVWAADLASEENTPRTSRMAAAGLRGAIGFPILSGREVRGVLEFCHGTIEPPDPSLLAMMAAIGSQIAQFIERKQTESRLRHTEDQFRQAQKMEAIGRLAGGIAHDFNNLLTGILGYSELILASLGPGDTFHEELKEIQKAADRAALLTRQLLAFSRKQVLATKVLDLNAVIADTQKMLGRLIGEDVQLITALDPQLRQVKADPTQVQQVIVNLAVNARDAMPRGGNLTIQTANVELDQAFLDDHPEVAPGRYVLLTISDTGCGMDEATKARLFEPFFTTKEVGKGTGLGLATVYGIIKQSGGHVEVASQPGHGTTFQIYLPRIGETAPLRKSHPGLRTAPNGHETVLLVEDDDVVRALARTTLQQCGYTVLEASCGEEAIQVVEKYQGPIDLLLTDVVMPGMGGSPLAQHLQGAGSVRQVLFMSGYTDDAVVRHGIIEDEVPFLHKPFTPVNLAKKMREVLDATADDGRYSAGIREPSFSMGGVPAVAAP